MRQPNDYTHQEDAKIELRNITLLFVSMLVFPYTLYLVLENILQVFSITFLVFAGSLDLLLTSDALHRGYQEQNYYRVFFSLFGEKNGFLITATLNFAIRAVISCYFLSYPVVIMFIALATFFGPLWNALVLRSFRDDIVVEMPTNVLTEEGEQTIDAGNKRRLEIIKDGSQEEPKE